MNAKEETNEENRQQEKMKSTINRLAYKDNGKIQVA